MQPCSFIRYACSLPSAGNGKELDSKQASQMLKADTLAWVHMDAASPQTAIWLKEHVSYLDDFVLQALLADETRPRFEAIGEGALVILRGVNLNENADPEDMISVRMWVDPHRIITLGRRPLKALSDLKNIIISEQGIASSGDFLAMLVARLIERMQPTIVQLDDITDAVEEKILAKPDKSLRSKIINIRQDAILLRRYIAPQKDAVMHIRNSDLPWLNTLNKRSLQESSDQLLRYVENLDAIRERAQIVQDELSNILSEQLNKNMYVLSVIAAIFLPLGFLTGLLGINIGGMPGADNPDAFWIFCLMLLGVIIGQAYLFKKMKWF